jgi:type II secretory pathway component PulC
MIRGMKRPPWIAIVLGLCAWGGVIALAMNDVWWPLWVGGGITAVALIAGLVATLWARRFVKSASSMAKAEVPSARTEPIAEPPKATGRSGPRTNARTAGRRNSAKGHKGAATALVMGLCAAHAHGCGLRDDKAKPEEAKAEAKGDAKADAKAEAAKAPVVPLTASGEDPALAAVLERAIRPPPTGEATYELDPFVAALVFERAKAGIGPTFTRLEKPVEAGPQAGFVVGEIAEGTLAHRLGLRTGDVVEAINGVVLTSPDRVGFGLDGASKRVELTIHRDEVSIVQQYTLIDGLAWTELLAGFTGDADPRLADASALEGGADAGAAGGAGTPADEPADDGRGEGVVPAEPPPTEPVGDDGSVKPPSGGGKLPSGGGGGGGTSPKPKTTPTPPPKTTPTPPPSGASPVQCESSAKCTITQSYFNSMVDNPAKLESQADIVPAIANDVHSGYKLKNIKSGSAISKLGFQSNDKITHINGKDLTDDFQAAELYMGISGTKVFKIRYERGGAKLVKTVLVK